MVIISVATVTGPNGDEAENFEQLLIAAQLPELAHRLRAGKHCASLPRKAHMTMYVVATGIVGAARK